MAPLVEPEITTTEVVAASTSTPTGNPTTMTMSRGTTTMMTTTHKTTTPSYNNNNNKNGPLYEQQLEQEEEYNSRCRLLSRENHSASGISSSSSSSPSLLRLDFSSLPLFGRDEEQEMLVRSLHNACLLQSQVVVVHGPSGVGKSSLVVEALSPVLEGGAFLFCSAKHNPTTADTKVLSPLLLAFGRLLHNVQRRYPHLLLEIRQILEQDGDDDILLNTLLHPHQLSSTTTAAIVSKNSTRTNTTAATTSTSSIHSNNNSNNNNKDDNNHDGENEYQRLYHPHATKKRQAPQATRVSLNESSIAPHAVVRSLDRFHRVFRVILQTIASAEHPVVLFLDDLQWADRETMALLNYLLRDAKKCSSGSTSNLNAYGGDGDHILFLLSYRNCLGETNEEVGSYLFEKETQQILGEDPIYLALGPLEFETIQSMIAAAVDVEPPVCEALTAIVYQKSRGNCLAAQQFLALVQDRGFLSYLSRQSVWIWDLDQIVTQTGLVTDSNNNNNNNNCDQLQDILLARIEGLSTAAQQILVCASFLGTVFDTPLLLQLLQEQDEDTHQLDVPTVRNAFATLLKIGLLERTTATTGGVIGVGGHLQNPMGSTPTSTKRFKFCHDIVQQTAYALIPEGPERDAIHVQIGYILKRIMENASKPALLFSAVDHLNLGASTQITNPYDQEQTARLNLLAAKEASAQSSFGPAATYAHAGVVLLCGGQTEWPHHMDQHQLALELYCFEAEMYLRTNQVQQCRDVVQVILRHAPSLQDKVRAYLMLVQVLGKTGQVPEAMKQGLSALRLLGHVFPSQHRKWQVLPEIVKTKRLLRGYSPSEIMALPLATDPLQIGAVQIMTAMALALFQSPYSKVYLPILVCRIVQTTLKSGLHPSSPYGFAVFGTLLCVLGKVDEGYTNGVLAIRLLDALHHARALESIVILAVHATVFHWKMRYKDVLVPLWTGYRLGMETDQMDHAFANAVSWSVLSYCSGTKLSTLSVQLEDLCRRAEEHKQTMALLSLQTLRQLLINLMGRAQDPLTLSGEAFHPRRHRHQQQQQKHHHPKKRPLWEGMDSETVILRRRLELAYLLHSAKLEELMLEFEGDGRGEAMDESKRSHVSHVREVFVSGLCYLRLARFNTKYRKLAKKRIVLLSKYCQRGAISCNHMLLILQAEQESVLLAVANNGGGGGNGGGRRGSNAAAAAAAAGGGNRRRMHDRAIASAGKEGFLGDEALANELAGDLSLQQNDPGNAKRYYLRAFGLYQEWGAKAKVQQLMSSHGELMGKSIQHFYDTNNTNGNSGGTKPAGVLRSPRKITAAASSLSSSSSSFAVGAAGAPGTTTKVKSVSFHHKPIMPRASTKKIRFEPVHELHQQRSVLMMEGARQE